MKRLKLPNRLTQPRLDKLLAELLDQPRSQIVKLIKSGQVFNAQTGHPLKGHYQVKGGEEIEIGELPVYESEGDSQPINWSTQIVFEDESILVLNKQAGQVVHPGAGQTKGTIAQELKLKYPNLPTVNESPVSYQRAGIVHRLDKDTSGLLLIAKTPSSLASLQSSFKKRTVKKVYQAILVGDQPTVEVNQPIGRNPKQRRLQAVIPSGRAAQSQFICQKTGQIDGIKLSYHHINLLTGRTHQIRVHARWLGHPVLGDKLYLNKLAKSAYATLKPSHLFLHAATLTIIHPSTSISTTFTAPLPTYWASYLLKLGAS